MDFENCRQLKVDHLAGIGNLLHLKYLWFKNARTLKELPEELARLQELEIDIHGRDRIMIIPETVHRLVRSVHLYLNDYDTVPDEMAAVQGLRVLEGVSVYTQSIRFLEGLGKLEHLRRLSISFINSDADEDYDKKLEKAICSISELGKAELESLIIYIKDELSELILVKVPVPWFPVPPYSALRELVICGESLEMVPEWITSLVKLEKLELPMDRMGEEDAKILGGLPCLRHLIISWDTDITEENLERSEAAITRAMEAHPNRPTVDYE
jgi:disease resistance protein RPM1